MADATRASGSSELIPMLIDMICFTVVPFNETGKKLVEPSVCLYVTVVQMFLAIERFLVLILSTATSRYEGFSTSSHPSPISVLMLSVLLLNFVLVIK